MYVEMQNAWKQLKIITCVLPLAAVSRESCENMPSAAFVP